MESTRECILQRSGELFSEKGYRAISMREIAEACGISKPAVYHYFASKEQLYIEVLQRELDRFVADLGKEVGDQPSAVERLHAVVRSYLGILSQRLSLIHLILRDMGVIEAEIRQMLQKRGADLLQPLRQVIQYGADRGEFRPVNPNLAALSLSGMMNVFITRSVIQPGVRIEEDEVLHTIDLMLNGLLT